MQSKQAPLKAPDKKTALAKAEHFCAYQERSQQEVRDKLYSLGLHHQDVEELITELIQGNFLNEERFACTYALGKFRMKLWGKLKITEGLKFKRVPPGLISKALSLIDQDEYLSALKTVLTKKAPSIKEADPFRKKQKLAQYAIQKGYESDLVFDALKSSNLL